MRYVLAVTISLLMPFAASVSAQTTPSTPQSGQRAAGTPPQPPSTAGSGTAASAPVAPQAPQTAGRQSVPDGRQFGEHVSSMAPEHPLLHGVLFGDCVSEMAIAGECPHHD
ncbi:MAG: hypothetical protein AB1452_07215 [Pseudomonadota bacterium]